VASSSHGDKCQAIIHHGPSTNLHPTNSTKTRVHQNKIHHISM
jgi:hypothetical protein